MPDLGRILDMLDRDGALEIEPQSDPPGGPRASVWPSVENGEEVFEVDHARLFPTHNPTDRGYEDFEVHGDDWLLSEDDVGEIVGEVGRDVSESTPPGWDVWAWYQPIHYFGPEWGIYIRETGLMECARRIAASLPPGLAVRSSAMV